jgi:phage/plasmid-associated DNA primase
MYKGVKNSAPVMKLIFMHNKLPKIYFTDYAVKWRLAVINFNSIFVEEQNAFDKQQADELRKRRALECLIQVKDDLYFETHV